MYLQEEEEGEDSLLEGGAPWAGEEQSLMAEEEEPLWEAGGQSLEAKEEQPSDVLEEHDV